MNGACAVILTSDLCVSVLIKTVWFNVRLWVQRRLTIGSAFRNAVRTEGRDVDGWSGDDSDDQVDYLDYLCHSPLPDSFSILDRALWENPAEVQPDPQPEEYCTVFTRTTGECSVTGQRTWGGAEEEEQGGEEGHDIFLLVLWQTAHSTSRSLCLSLSLSVSLCLCLSSSIQTRFWMSIFNFPSMSPCCDS